MALNIQAMMCFSGIFHSACSLLLRLPEFLDCIDVVGKRSTSEPWSEESVEYETTFAIKVYSFLISTGKSDRSN